MERLGDLRVHLRSKKINQEEVVVNTEEWTKIVGLIKTQEL